MSVQTQSIAGATRPYLWILDRRWDLVLFVGTPALVLPVIMVAERFFAATELYLVVAAFGALGHHLPGMMRAYGDRALFARFKTRFIVAPIFLVAVCAVFAVLDPELYALTLIAYGWGLWHGLMQTHGFMRIYDAKVKSFDTWTARLDQLMCLTWFGAGVIFAPSRVHYILEAFYHAGGVAIPVGAVTGLRIFWGAATAVVTLAFVVNLLHRRRLGHPPSAVKLLLLGSTVAFWMYCCLVIPNLLVGILMFELFHDVQYLAIVWLYNRKRALSDPQSVGRFTRLIFARGKILIAVYVGLCMLYGSLDLLDKQLVDSTAFFSAVLVASGLLHFYYDSFIWKVKEKSTRQALGIEGGSDVRAVTAGLRQRFGHALTWTPFVVVVGVLLASHFTRAMTPVEARVLLGRTFSDYDLAQSNLAIALYQEGDLEGAIEANRRALELEPNDVDLAAMARNNLGWALVELAEKRILSDQQSAAMPLLEEARALDPTFPDMLNTAGAELARNGDMVAAIGKYRTAVAMQPDHPHFRGNLAAALASRGLWNEALEQARAGHRLLPSDPRLNELIRRIEAMTSDNNG